MNIPGRDGQTIELTKPKGERGKRAPRNANESVLESLRHKDLITDEDYQAGLKYHGLLRRAATGSSIPDVGRIPGQGNSDGDANHLESILELEKINSSKTLTRQYRNVLSFTLHPWTQCTLTQLDTMMCYPARHMKGRTVLIEALKELADILGYTTRR